MAHALPITRLVQQTVRHPWPIFLGALLALAAGVLAKLLREAA
jgi:hypothetical protein